MSRDASKPKCVIRLKELSKSFRGHLGIGRKPAVERLSLEVERGEVFGLLGPNGAGKTTTLKMMLGLLRPDGGEVSLFDRPPSDPRSRARIGYLPENPYFYDYLTAEEFLDFYGRLQGLKGRARRAAIERAIGLVGLQGKERTALRKFSKGMIQRVGLAQAIQHQPDLVILDEPMSGLDPVGRREVRDLILTLSDEGGTVFFSSHILQDAEMICDRVAILDGGSLRSVGRLRELVSEKARWFEVALRGALPDLPGCEAISDSAEGRLVKVADVESLGSLLAAARQAGGQVLSVWPRRETLEDMFIKEIGRGTGGEEKR
jgi:ABC-2 type transport system ATP-binding protein